MQRKKFLVFIFFLSSFIFTGCETVQYGTKYSRQLNALPEPNVDKGIICVIRPSAFGASLAAWDLFIDGKFVGKLVSGSYIYQTVNPGTHTVNITGGVVAYPVETVVKTGETIYLKTRIAMGLVQARIFIETCPLEEAREHIKKYPAVNINKENQGENTQVLEN